MMNSCVLRLLLTWIPKNAESICRKAGEKLRRPAMHAFIILCGTKSVRIAPPNTMTDSYTRFLPANQPYLNFMTRTPKSKPHIRILRKYLVFLPWWIVNTILLLCWSTPCFITFLSYTQQLDLAELYPILTHCWGLPSFTMSLGYSHFPQIAELYPS